MSTLYLVLGNIGSGKSTAIVNLLRTEELRGVEYVGEDIYKRMFYNEGELKPNYRRAKALVSYKISRLIECGQSFITEFVPGAENKFDTVKQAKEAGYEIVIFYLGTDSVKTNVNRVVDRISQGADFVSEEKVVARDAACIANFNLICELSNTLVLIDNSVCPRIFGYKKDDVFTFYGRTLPQWFNATLNNLKNLYKINYQGK